MVTINVYVQKKEARVRIWKLTLRLEEELIDQAKRVARERRTSVSKMVAGFFESIEDPKTTGEDGELGEITRRLRGSIKPMPFGNGLGRLRSGNRNGTRPAAALRDS